MSGDDENESVTSNEVRAEQALRASELSYRRLFEAAKDGILILDVETGRIDDVNPFLVELLGFSRSEMLGKTVGDLSPFKDLGWGGFAEANLCRPQNPVHLGLHRRRYHASWIA